MNWRRYGSEESPIHQSHLKRCPMATKLSLDGAAPDHRTIEAVVGTLGHAWCALSKAEVPGKPVGMFAAQFQLATTGPSVPILWNRKSQEKEFADLVEAVIAFRDRFPVTEHTQTEVPFVTCTEDQTRKPYRRYWLAGTIDRIDCTGQFDDSYWLSVHDLKFGNPMACRQDKIQLGIYAFGALSITGRWPDELGYVFPKECLPYKVDGTRGDGTKYHKGDPKGNPVYTIDFPQSQLPMLTGLVREFVRPMRMGIFDRAGLRFGGMPCVRCEFASTCLPEVQGRVSVDMQKRINEAMEV